ncbi:two-component response regulator EHD1 isoform X3 [Hevea brasiliensis]|uniref:two-component response regulator EHD1 isoform X3 n=1 Tax=Hevea brasiliensis TaxID=3981 RepID=UPI0025F5704E|nr:two-component response regulator EHD1 isoform X3 [Hevea brasiliensis]
MDVFPGGDVPTNTHQLIDDFEIENGGPSSVTELGFSSEFELQLQLENDPEIKFTSPLELDDDDDDAFLALEESLITPTSNMVYKHVEGEARVLDPTVNMVHDHVEGEVVVVEETRSPNMVHDHVLSYDGEAVVVEETPTLNMVHDHAISSEESEVAVVVENTPTLNMVRDHVVSSEEREVVVMKETPALHRVYEHYFSFEGCDARVRDSEELDPNSVFFTSDSTPRLRWTSKLHKCFIKAVRQLGGPRRATPKVVQQIMKIRGLTLYHVKGHLQKYQRSLYLMRGSWTSKNGKSFFVSQDPQSSNNSLSLSPFQGNGCCCYVYADVKGKGKAKVDGGDASSLYMQIQVPSKLVSGRCQFELCSGK